MGSKGGGQGPPGALRPTAVTGLSPQEERLPGIVWRSGPSRHKVGRTTAPRRGTAQPLLRERARRSASHGPGGGALQLQGLPDPPQALSALRAVSGSQQC